MPKSIALLVVLGLAIILASFAGYKYLLAPPDATNPHAPTQNTAGGQKPARERIRTNRVTALGRLEPEGGLVAISGMVGDRLAKLNVNLGDPVKAGDELAVLDSHSLRQAELELAEAQLAEARHRQAAEESKADALLLEAQLAVDQAELHPLDLAAHRSKVEALRSGLATAEHDLKKIQELGGSIVSGQERDHQELVVEQAKQELVAAEAQQSKLEKTLPLAVNQAKAQQATAEAQKQTIPSLVQLESLKKSVELAKARLKMTTIYAPSDGRVVKIMVRVGETLGPQPILQIADTRRMVAVAEIYEDQVLQVRNGQDATITSPALDEPVKGKVTYVSSVVAKNAVGSLNPTASADARVIEARILLEPNDDIQRLINKQVDVQIDSSSAGRRAESRPVAEGADRRKKR